MPGGEMMKQGIHRSSRNAGEPTGIVFPVRLAVPLVGHAGAHSWDRQIGDDATDRTWPIPDLERSFVNPAAVFAAPRTVLDHPRLTTGCKREILRRWAWDEYLKEVAAFEGMTEGEPSCLDEVKNALLRLDETWKPKPSAPASAVPVLRYDDELAAA